MLFVLIALWSVAVIIWLSDPRSAVNRRLGAVAFSGGAGALAAVLDMQWLPHAAQAGASEAVQLALYRLQGFASLSSYYGLPYFFVLFAISYRPAQLPKKLGRMLPWLLLAPIVFCVLFTPPYSDMYPITFSIVVWWAVPYIVYGTYQVLAKMQLPSAYSRTHWIICSAVLPPVLFCMIMNYLLPSFGMLRMWVYNTWVVGLGVAVFVIGLFTYGFMGIRVLIDRRRFDSTLRAVTSGTAMLNHAIKNEAGKMRLFAMKMKVYAQETNQSGLLADIETVLNSARHMEEMVQRVHRKTEDLILRPDRCDLARLVAEKAADYESPDGSLRIAMTLAEGWSCMIDKAQVSEALGNIIANAIEAMAGQGELGIALHNYKRDLVIEVRDSGPGMDRKQVHAIFDPFYTTKSGGANFGLGLPYAYHVMRKHKGSLSLRSKKGEGASFFMIFPKRAVKAVKAVEPALTATQGGNGVESHSGRHR